MFIQDRNAIQIQLSTDDFEVCNALRSKAGVHKLCAVYFQVRNVPEEFRSQLRYHNLVCLCYTDYVKEAGGFDIISELILKELQILETEGVEIGPNLKLKGALVNVSADNLGANGVFGFSESFSATYYCRQCELSKEECSQTVRERGDKLRSKASYEKCLQKVHTMKKLDLKKNDRREKELFIQ